MLRRVVIGGSGLGRRLARELTALPGDLIAIVEDDDALERLRDDGINATAVDRFDVDTLRSSGGDPTIIILTSESPAVDADRLSAVDAAFPRAWVATVSPTPWPDPDGVADQQVVTDQLVADRIAADLLEPAFVRSLELVRTVSRLPEPIAVVMHDNPDPDAIAAALGLVAIATAAGREAVPLYAGSITHQENRAFVNLLELELETYEAPFDESTWQSVALVDHAHPGVNDQLEATTPIDIVIDHHPAREEADATFVDRRHDVGATSTLVADHLLRAQIDLDSRLATALWYGIQVDTDGLRRGVSELDFSVSARLRDRIDDDLLERIETPQVSAGTLETIGAAIDNRTVHDEVLIADTGDLLDRDALAQAADALLRMEGISTVLVFGRGEEQLIASGRSRSDRIDVGEAMRLAFGQIGDAGGHEDMAGAQLPVEVVWTGPDGDDPAGIVDVITDRFLEGIEVATRPLPSGYLHDEAGLE